MRFHIKITAFLSDGLQRRIERLWYGNDSIAVLLVPFSWVYRVAVSIRRAAFRARWLSSVTCSAPVIVVGNVTVGGTGKTPLVIWLVRKLVDSGLRPGIVSRGYGAGISSEPVLVDADLRASDVGDEPLLITRRTGRPVCVCVDRVAAAQYLLRETDVNVIVADDGLQHYRLRRDLEFVVIDGQRGLGNSWMLPAGPLREPVRRLSEADLILCNGPAAGFAGPVFELVPGRARALSGDRERDLADFVGLRVWAVAGIGNPDSFYTLLARHGIDIEPVMVADHGSVDLERLVAEHNRPILMTEKDVVKYPETTITDAWYVPVDVRMTSESESVVDRLLNKLETS